MIECSISFVLLGLALWPCIQNDEASVGPSFDDYAFLGQSFWLVACRLSPLPVRYMY
jgi:hypothetical protein